MDETHGELLRGNSSPGNNSVEACSDVENLTELSRFDLSGEWDEDVVVSFCSILRDELKKCAVDSRDYMYALSCLDHMEFQFCAMYITWNQRRRGFKIHKKLSKLKTEELKEEVLELSTQLLQKTEGCGPQGLIRRIEKEHKNLYGHGSSRKAMWTAMLMSKRELRTAFTEETAPLIPQIAEETYDALGSMPQEYHLSSTEVVVPFELSGEQKEFLVRLCQFWSISFRSDRLYRQNSDGYDSDE